ncbi:MAG: 50S ribosomal protein L22 [Omnitrophica bacterium RIFCSPLOWO2_02_FULL_45_16]|nr:MAG: 50S ribosomal protein L22 [Omnitrophica bacterium RIFCSPHIGHO2_02_FULL_46_20]OGW92553.1 MAG: 50S ribosomal protein L22 [Omnitrophica bacterium RIFCSPLOWO2_12_FULL_45_13]OGW93167.1 MAG: 50S ribosomal protein L22 [Omnitrophica bacterium RIFCSPLOWO2_01_FULL_45_24]OGX00134.1 MAG: 50S ribosomal protein L22 [Omnitrophica bacterium RIFCSPLOWO2_02_FULL_45_16]
MTSRAILRYARISPRKFRLVIPLVKGKKAEEAIAILSAVKKRASGYAIDLLKSAVANAKGNVQGLDTSTLYIAKMIADPGPMLKRFRAASMGRAGSIHKHTSHLTVELDVLRLKTGAAAETKAAEKSKIKKAKTVQAPNKEMKEKEAGHKEKKRKIHKK